MIRPYKPSDKSKLIELLRLNIPKYFAQAEEKDFDDYLDNYTEDYFVVEENGEIVGAGGINYFPDAGLARISWDVIHPDFQGRGIGKQLMQHRLEHIRKDPTLWLVVVRTTQLVYGFYEKMGFALEKTEKDYWAEGFDLYQLRMAFQ